MNLLQFRRKIDKDGKIEAVKAFFPSCSSLEEADMFIFGHVMKLLQRNRKLDAALLLWGEIMFNPFPECVQKVWKGIDREAKVLVQGGGSLGKSYTLIAWILLDWWIDPMFTSVKIISTTSKHAKSNTYSTLVRLFRNTIIKMPGVVNGQYLGLDPKDKKSGIEVIAIPQGDDGKGRLKGFHPDPRATPHPRFGVSSRIRVLLDECEEVPIGVWEGISNLLGSRSGNETIKVAGAYNPKDQTSRTAREAEPIDGWEAFDVEKGVNGKDEWMSKEGWFVIRLDGKKTENVKLKKNVYHGLLTLEGYRDHENKNGGNSPEYFSLGRGAYPPQGVNNVIIPFGHIKMARGEFVFTGSPINIGGVDTAVDGRDICAFTKSRAGMAGGFIPKDTGKLIKFSEPRLVLQIDQQFECLKGDVKIVGDDIIRNAIALGISPEYLGIDSTGNGKAVWAYICAIWGEIQGVDFNEAATKVKILEQDKRTPFEQYDGIVTEVWYALRYWMEFGYLALSSGLRNDPLESELTGRRYVLSSGHLVKVEKKDDYKKRLGHSPDYADSLTVNLHAARMREAIMGSMTGLKRKEENMKGLQMHGVVDRRKWVDMGV